MTRVAEITDVEIVNHIEYDKSAENKEDMNPSGEVTKNMLPMTKNSNNVIMTVMEMNNNSNFERINLSPLRITEKLFQFISPFFP